MIPESHFDFPAWCATVPEISLQDKGYWVARSLSEVSYPENGHRTFSEIEERSFWFNHRNAVIQTLVARHSPTGPIFDIGGGNGYVSWALARSGYEAIVIEPGKAGALTARARNLPVVQAAFQDLSIEPESIPNIGMFDVLEHIEDHETALSEIVSTLKPGGLLFLTVPAFMYLWSNEDVLAGHHRRYTRSTLKSCLMKAGLNTLCDGYFFSILAAPVFLVRAVPTAMGLPLRRAAEQDHLPSSSSLFWLISKALRRELSGIQAAKPPFVGTSIFAVAKKPG